MEGWYSPSLASRLGRAGSFLMGNRGDDHDGLELCFPPTSSAWELDFGMGNEFHLPTTSSPWHVEQKHRARLQEWWTRWAQWSLEWCPSFSSDCKGGGEMPQDLEEETAPQWTAQGLEEENQGHVFLTSGVWHFWVPSSQVSSCPSFPLVRSKLSIHLLVPPEWCPVRELFCCCSLKS